MRIAEFHVEGFGRLANLSMTDIPPGLSIVLGENEAGTTTLLEFLRSILFGLPARKQKEFYPPLNGGRKAGRLVLRNEQSERFIVERCEGKGIGLLTVTMPDGSQGGDAEFRPQWSAKWLRFTHAVIWVSRFVAPWTRETAQSYRTYK